MPKCESCVFCYALNICTQKRLYLITICGAQTRLNPSIESAVTSLASGIGRASFKCLYPRNVIALCDRFACYYVAIVSCWNSLQAPLFTFLPTRSRRVSRYDFDRSFVQNGCCLGQDLFLFLDRLSQSFKSI